MGTMLVVVIAVAASCRAPYRADVTLVGNGRYMIRAEVEPGASEGLAYQYAYSRAHEVCPEGYEVVDSKANANTKYERVAVFGRRAVDAPEIMLMVRCGSPPAGAPVRPESRAPEASLRPLTPEPAVDAGAASAVAVPPVVAEATSADDRRVVRINEPLFCFLESSLEQGECTEKLVECNGSRIAYMAATKAHPGACVPTAAAACFDIRSRMSGIEMRRCYTSISQCEQVIALLWDEPDWQFSSKRCYSVRTRRLP